MWNATSARCAGEDESEPGGERLPVRYESRHIADSDGVAPVRADPGERVVDGLGDPVAPVEDAHAAPPGDGEEDGGQLSRCRQVQACFSCQ